MPFVYVQSRLKVRPTTIGAGVGSVVSTVGALMPAASGEDIGCGIIAVRTPFAPRDLEIGAGGVAELRRWIEAAVPLPADGRNQVLTKSAAVRVEELEKLALAMGFDPDDHQEDWRLQIGTVGGVGHAVELAIDEDGAVWVTVHAGSRDIGDAIAREHRGVARKLADRYNEDLPHQDLAYLVEGTPAFDAYVRQSGWLDRFAHANREELADRVSSCVSAWAGAGPAAVRRTAVTDGVSSPTDSGVADADRIDSVHNFVKTEQHMGRRIWVTCRGAINAHRGARGVVPSPNGGALFIVEGEGNSSWLYRYPHGPVSGGRRVPSTRAVLDGSPRDVREGAPAAAARQAKLRAIDEDVRTFMTSAIEVVQLRRVLRPMVRVSGTAPAARASTHVQPAAGRVSGILGQESRS